MRFRGLALAIFIALLAACGSDGEEPPNDRRDEAVEWYLRSISEDELTINLVYTISGVASDCERKGSARTNETADRVELIAYKSVTTDRNRACTEELGYVEESVRLRGPLGGRALVGCRPGKLDPSEDRICRDLERSRNAGIFEFSPAPG